MSAAVDGLLANFIRERRIGNALAEQYFAATKLMPAWAQSGPEYLLHDGSKGGGNTGWPEVAELPAPPEHVGNRKVIRPSPHQMWKDWSHVCLMPSRDGIKLEHSDGSIRHIPATEAQLARRRQMRLNGFQRLRKIIARIREQRAEKAKVGLPQLGDLLEESNCRLDLIRAEMIIAAGGASPDDIAVLALIEFGWEEDDFSLRILKRVAPSLSGLLRIVVDDMIAYGPEDINETLYMGAGEGDPLDLVVRSEVEGRAAA